MCVQKMTQRVHVNNNEKIIIGSRVPVMNVSVNNLQVGRLTGTAAALPHPPFEDQIVSFALDFSFVIMCGHTLCTS